MMAVDLYGYDLEPKMIFSLTVILALISSIKYEMISAISVRRFVYQKDISEHCRRRVMPSVFLGSHVVDANSQILHFTRLELPYSCFISVRSESGTNIILVVQIVSEENIVSSCSKNGNQLLVYEMGETFGGYWGPLSDSIIKRQRFNDTKYYTLKTTQPTEPSTVVNDEYEDTVEISSKIVNSSPTDVPDDGADYIRMELPIVNVSGNLVPGETPQKNVYNIDDSFDFIYDVTPSSGVSYDTSIIPLVQFSLKKKISIHRTGNQDQPKYKMKYNLHPVTPDERLQFSTRHTKKNKKQKFNANQRITFKTNKSLFTTYRRHLYFEEPFTIMQQHVLTKPINIATKPKSTTQSTLATMEKQQYTNMSWEFIYDLMKMYNKTVPTITTKETPSEFYNITNNFQKILDIKYNSSVYLSPNLSVYYKDVPLYASDTKKSTTISDNTFGFMKSTESHTSLTKTKLSLTRNIDSSLLLDLTTAFDNINNSEKLITFSTQNITTQIDMNDQKINFNETTLSDATIARTTYFPISKRHSNLAGSLVDHESWENVVQVAPAMAGLLNNMTSDQSHNIEHFNIPKSDINRGKRYIQSVHIQNARPHNTSTRGDAATTAVVKYDIADMQEFAQLVESQDDELHGRVALRYLRRYVGPALLNICDYTDTATRHVYLFNSSRIVIAISNFTMDRMTVVLTPARTVVTGDGRCPEDHLECQVSGARVCIDSLTACDGIPNCGSYEIYDEDRLMCGAAIGLQHNVYLAAFTFLAVLLTVLYGVHYWLKRCVPKVSDAFFLYTDGTENVLYLDSIMRSPTDDDDVSKMVYQGSIFEEDLLMFSEVSEEQRPNKLKRFFKAFFTCNYFRSKPKQQDAYVTMAQEGLFASLEEHKKRFSYAELELRKMLDVERGKKDIAVQTGESLEMNNLAKQRIHDEKQHDASHKSYLSESLLVLKEGSTSTFEQLEKNRVTPDELSILNFFNNLKSDSSKSESSENTIKIKPLTRNSIAFEEKEIKSHNYDLNPKSKKKPTSSRLSDVDVYAAGPSDRIKKRLRFDEGTTTIPPVEYDDNNDDVNEHLGRRRSVVLGVGKTRRKTNLDSIDEGDEGVTNIQGDTIRFWSKSKKTKKKTEIRR